MKAAGVTSIVGAGFAASAGSAAASEEYDVIEVGPGEFWQHRLSEGETFENVLIDITAQGAQAKIWATGISDFEIRNVGWLGRWDTRERHAFIHAACSGHGVIENVYMGDGAASTNYPNSPTGVFVNRRHSGHIDIDNLHVQHVADNAVYASEPTRTGGGTVDIRNSYARDMQPAAWRVPGGSTVENCVAINCHRGVWVRYGEIDVIDCDLQGNRVGDMVAHASGIAGHAAPVINAENTAWGTDTVQSSGAINGSSVGSTRRTDPEDVDGVPLSAEEAAGGESGDSSPSPPSNPGNGDDGDGEDDPDLEDIWNDDEPNHLVLEDGTSGVSEYQLTGYGTAEAGDDADTNPDDPYRDTVSSDGDEFVVEGFLGGYRDDFYVEGRIDSVTVDSDVTAVVNGNAFDPDELEGVGSWDDEDESSDDSDEQLPHVLLFDGTEASGPTTYSFTIDGEVEPSEYRGATIDDENEIEGTTVRGIVANWRDAYRFSGDITDFRLAGEADINLEYDVDE
ncbi:hypothetical protein CYV19_00040 [Natronobacterium gregoryi SP2]|uniref:Right handed beta helix region n=1 Tax=Natronobacterium gregoryi (strain ATCC 43098 / DSM 3393 / CCM 3738 / CIP 104747 / IAM 13177 / JCM 8860 / NBRC 102187 / NCIMB 2189 / SP2) TaxID=797304 RepID=A0A2J4JK04_NATGS|nr:hypothetical protein CYV19_00040 [Natronobacterium gregoryi SP2]